MTVHEWVARERAVVVEPLHERDVLRVRVLRADGTEIAREFTRLALTASRLHPLELIQATFPDRLDRLAIALLGRPMLDAGHSALAHDRSYARARSGASDVPRDFLMPPWVRLAGAVGNAAAAVEDDAQALGHAARRWRDRTDAGMFDEHANCRCALPERAEEKPRAEPLAKRNPALPVYRPR